MDQKQKMILAGARLVISDDEFNKASEDILNEQKAWIEKENVTELSPDLIVLTRHNFADELKRIVIKIPGFPPPMGAVISRYEILQLAGAKYAEDFIIKKSRGQKNMPIAVFFVMEAWMKAMTRKEVEEMKENPRSVEHDKGVTEMFVVSGMTMDGRENAASMNIKRGTNNVMFLTSPVLQKFTDGEDSYSGHSHMLESFYRGIARKLHTSGIGGERES